MIVQVGACLTDQKTPGAGWYSSRGARHGRSSDRTNSQTLMGGMIFIFDQKPDEQRYQYSKEVKISHWGRTRLRYVLGGANAIRISAVESMEEARAFKAPRCCRKSSASRLGM